MSFSPMEQFLLEPLRQGGQDAPVYQKLLENKTQEEQEECLGNLLAETLRRGNVEDTFLVGQWILEQFEGEAFSQAVYQAFWSMVDVGRFELVQQLWVGCLQVLDTQEERVGFFMDTILFQMGDIVYHPLFVGTDAHSFLNETSSLLEGPLKGQASRILSIMQKSMLEQEEFGKAGNSEDGMKRLLSILDGVEEKTTMISLCWGVFEKILDARQMMREHQRTGELKGVIDKVFSFPFSWDDVLHTQPQGRSAPIQYLLGKEGQVIQQDTISYLAFVLTHKTHDSFFVQEGYKHPKAALLLNHVQATSQLDDDFNEDKKVVEAFLEKSVLLQSGLLSDPALPSPSRGRKI